MGLRYAGTATVFGLVVGRHGITISSSLPSTSTERLPERDSEADSFAESAVHRIRDQNRLDR